MITPSNMYLPPQTTSFIGRDDEIIQIAHRLSEPACRLLTLVGPGGIGKTRLAIEVAKTIAEKDSPVDGLYFVDLQPVPNVDLLDKAIANTLGVMLTAHKEPHTQLLDYLQSRHALLLIDNFEHLLDGVDLLTDIVKAAPHIKLLVTSREALNVQEEWLWQVGGLQVPDTRSRDGIEDYSAVRMFVERTQHIRSDFTLLGQEGEIARICQLVEGMPLALELAASWTRALSCGEITIQLQRGLDFLKTHLRNMPERHRSMRAVFDRSWSMLTDNERAVFPELSVFRGGFRHEAAEAVARASISALAGLVDKSLLKVDSSGRYHLHELVRQYAAEQLETTSGGKELVQDRHCTYFAGFLQALAAELKSARQVSALDRIEQDIDNVREAWVWAVTQLRETEIHQAMHSLSLYYQMRGERLEGYREYAFLLAERLEREGRQDVLMGQVLMLREWNAMHALLTPDPNFERINEALHFFKNPIGVEIVMPLSLMSHFKFEGEEARYYPIYERLYRANAEHFAAIGEEWGQAWSLYCCGSLATINGWHEKAEPDLSASLTLFQKLGDRWSALWATGGLGVMLVGMGRPLEALQIYHERLPALREIGDLGGVMWTFMELGWTSLAVGDFQRAKGYILEALHFERESDGKQPNTILPVVVELFLAEGNQERPVELLTLLEQTHYHWRDAWVEFARDHLAKLKEELPLETFMDARQRGGSRDFKTTATALIHQLSNNENSLLDSHVLYAPLSQRELEVLRLMAAGLKNAEIAQKLIVAPGTVKAHTSAIYRKLDVTSRIQAVARAHELKLL